LPPGPAPAFGLERLQHLRDGLLLVAGQDLAGRNPALQRQRLDPVLFVDPGRAGQLGGLPDTWPRLGPAIALQHRQLLDCGQLRGRRAGRCRQGCSQDQPGQANEGHPRPTPPRRLGGRLGPWLRRRRPAQGAMAGVISTRPSPLTRTLNDSPEAHSTR